MRVPPALPENCYTQRAGANYAHLYSSEESGRSLRAARRRIPAPLSTMRARLPALARSASLRWVQSRRMRKRPTTASAAAPSMVSAAVGHMLPASTTSHVPGRCPGSTAFCHANPCAAGPFLELFEVFLHRKRGLIRVHRRQGGFVDAAIAGRLLLGHGRVQCSQP